MSKKKSIKWSDPKIKNELIKLVEEAPTPAVGYQAAANHFGVTYNAAYQAYRYVTGVYTKSKKKKSKAGKTSYIASIKVTQLKQNPFAIMTDMSVTEARGGSSPWLPMLLEQVIKLDPNDARMSVNIPLTVAPNHKAASTLVLAVKRALGENRAYKGIEIKIKTIPDANKKYVATRIWRVK